MSPDLTGASCAEAPDPELWHPKTGESGLAALLICRECPVRDACLEVAMERPVSGIWGGTSAEQRQSLARERGQTYQPTRAEARCKVTPVALRRRELQNGAPRKRPSNEPGSAAARRQEAIRLADAGVNSEAIAMLLGVGERVVRRRYLAEPDEAAS